MEAIARSREDDLWRLIFALGIRQVGEKAAKVLAARFGSMDALSTATEEELTAIDDVGPITAKYIRQWMDSPQSQDLLARLKAAGLNMTCKEEMVDRRFAGMTFDLTAALRSLPAMKQGEMIEKRAEGVRLRFQKDQLRGGGRERRQQAAKGAAAGHPRPHGR